MGWERYPAGYSSYFGAVEKAQKLSSTQISLNSVFDLHISNDRSVKRLSEFVVFEKVSVFLEGSNKCCENFASRGLNH